MEKKKGKGKEKSETLKEIFFPFNSFILFLRQFIDFYCKGFCKFYKKDKSIGEYYQFEYKGEVKRKRLTKRIKICVFRLHYKRIKKPMWLKMKHCYLCGKSYKKRLKEYFPNGERL